MARKAKVKREKVSAHDVAAEKCRLGLIMVHSHPMLRSLYLHASIVRDHGPFQFVDGWGGVTSDGRVYLHPTRRAEPEEWLYVVSHCLLHLGFEHFREKEHPREWNAACDAVLFRFLADLKLGRLPLGQIWIDASLPRDEEKLYRQFCEQGIPPGLQGIGMADRHQDDMIFQDRKNSYWGYPTNWGDCFGQGLANAVSSAVNVAAGVEAHLGADRSVRSAALRAREWFISSYPLLGALVAAFEIVEDPLVCQRLGIAVAAVDMQSKEIFMNPAASLTEEECRFVMAHEILHVGLSHDVRREGRDPYLWNVACDYVINDWLLEMKVGDMPAIGGLHDVELRGLSAEAIYDRIVTDLRRYRKLRTMCGVGVSDILERGVPEWWRRGEGVTLDEWYRQCLSQGLVYHENSGRGLLPAGLIEEIRALEVPPIPWDVELAHWFDRHFPPLEKIRTYARASRRQSSTPDIPRPRWVPNSDANAGRTFGVVLDTSGSMDRQLLAKALGAIASYSLSREVPAARVIFCDAQAYDEGYMLPEDIADRVRVRGRGGTVLQPGIDLLEKAEDFPRRGPILIITDGYCDRLHVHHEHAFLLPVGHSLPFVPKGEIFRIS